MAGYSGTPLAKKLGIKEGFRVALINAPMNFQEELGSLPEEAMLGLTQALKNQVIFCYVCAK